ncbi:hypothetical protein RF55_9871 [Lasius niger]|uniref:Uncharacterized protein n=1 Tax=Lasius niger TaxID=67767 RepID=A0A0J7KIX3_LASNI|nr:hypothetical protein RF55_9871 [Lasius niger]
MSNEPASGRKRGRPQTEGLASAFEELCEFIDNSDDCQFTLQELMRKLEENLLDSSYISMKMLKIKLMEEYGDGVVFATMRNKPTIVCFRGFGLKLINSWYTEKAKDKKAERMRIVETAGTIIREDIRTTAYDINDYPDLMNFTANAEDLIPKTLSALLNTIIMRNKKGKAEGIEKKCTAIAHAIISATRPRSFVSPILFGLAVYLFRKVASKSIVQAVCNMGFCSSYVEISQFEYSAAQSCPDVDSSSSSQFVFDNADFNINTMTGKDTFYAMGGIRCVTPHDAVKNRQFVKITSTSEYSEIGSCRQIQLHTFQRPKSGIEEIALKNVYSEAAFEKVAKPSSQDMLWIYGKFLEVPSFSAWQGFMETVTRTLPYTKSKIIALSFLNQPPSNYSTVYSVLIHAVEETKKMTQTTCIVTFDQPLYIKARDIVAAESAKPGNLSNVIVRLGGFHLLMSNLGSIGYIMGNSGLSELWTTVYASASVSHMLSGHAYARAIRAHFLTYSALSTIILEEMLVNDSDKEHLKQIFANFAENPPTFESIENNDVVNELKLQFSEHIGKLRERGRTALLWLHYHELIAVAMHFIQAERMGNWELHLDYMDSLKEKMTDDEFHKFTKESFFTIRRSDKHWCGVWSDMTIEQTLMRNMNSIGGITHGRRGFADNVLKKWIFGLSAAYHVCESIEKFCRIEIKSSNQHVELRDTRVKKDEDDCKKFILWFKLHFPFITSKNLISLSSGLIADDNIDCYKAKEIGKKSLEECIKDGGTFGSLKLKRQNMAKSISSSINSVKIQDNVIQVDTMHLLQRIICTVHSTTDLQMCFEFELASVPLSLFDEKGLMRKTKKSSLYENFDSVPDFTECEFIVDGGNLIQRVVWPQEGTFTDVYTAYLVQRFKYEGIATITADDDADLLIIQTAIEKSHRHDSVVIVGQDIDLLVLLIALTPENKDIRFWREAQGNIKERKYSSRNIQLSKVLKNSKETVLFAHAFSGCDTTSAFFGKGKSQTMNLFNTRKDLEDVVAIFNNPSSTKEEIASAGERFILALYKAPRKEVSLNRQRFIFFNKLASQLNHAVILSRLSPTFAAA